MKCTCLFFIVHLWLIYFCRLLVQSSVDYLHVKMLVVYLNCIVQIKLFYVAFKYLWFVIFFTRPLQTSYLEIHTCNTRFPPCLLQDRPLPDTMISNFWNCTSSMVTLSLTQNRGGRFPCAGRSKHVALFLSKA